MDQYTKRVNTVKKLQVSHISGHLMLQSTYCMYQ